MDIVRGAGSWPPFGLEHVVYMPQNSEEFHIGSHSGGLVSPDYNDKNRFRGMIKRVEIVLR
jgi:hypothetical protein